MNPHHFQGVPCQYGHNGIRARSNGECIECRKERIHRRTRITKNHMKLLYSWGRSAELREYVGR